MWRTRGKTRRVTDSNLGRSGDKRVSQLKRYHVPNYLFPLPGRQFNSTTICAEPHLQKNICRKTLNDNIKMMHANDSKSCSRTSNVYSVIVVSSGNHVHEIKTPLHLNLYRKLGSSWVYIFSYYWSKTKIVGSVRTALFRGGSAGLSHIHNQCFEQQ